MADITLTLGVRTHLRNNLRIWHSLFLLFSLLLFVLAGHSTANAAETETGRVTSAGSGLRFAIADFDGDLRPDLATIQAGRSVSGASSYWIQLQLTATGRQSIQVDAPVGGLSIEARDVNGDLAVDLVLTTIGFGRPVGVLLNDGHGRFSLTAATAFPGAFSTSKTNWVSSLNLATEALGVPSQSGASAYAWKSDFLRGCSPAKFIPPPAAGFPVSPFLFGQAGRAPPSAVSHL
jgi:hypothetical protein